MAPDDRGQALTRIVVADDHPVVRHGLRAVIEAADDMRVVGEAATGEELLELLSAVSCHVLVLDLSMPDTRNFELLRSVRQQFPAVPVLMLSVAPEAHYALRALKAGAAGYLTKRTAPDLLIEAIRQAVRGGVYLSPELSRTLAAAALRPEPRHGVTESGLSDRESEVLRLLAGGLSPTHIGQHLRISVKSVSTYRRRLLTKLNLGSTAALIHYAIAHGLIDA